MLIDNSFRKKVIPEGNVEEEILILEPLTAPEFLSPLSSHRKGNLFYSHPANIDFFILQMFDISSRFLSAYFFLPVFDGMNIDNKLGSA